MTDISKLSEKELRMQELCKVLESLKIQRDNARSARINNDIAYTNINSLIVSTNEEIARLEAAGIKRPALDEIQDTLKKIREKELQKA